MNKKKFAIASVASFIFLFIYEMVVHGYMLASMYAMTPTLWRPEADMKIWAMVLGYALIVLSLVYVFSQKMPKEAKCGAVHNGAALGVAFAVFGFISYAWMPISIGLACAWALSNFIKVVVIALITDKIYPNKA